MTTLVLEDNKESRRALCEMLRQISEEIIVEEAETRQEAETILNQGIEINLFLLDINLNIRDDNDISGLDFAKEIRERREHAFTPIVFISSYSSFEITSYREAQCYSFITKPFRKSEVEKIIRKVLNNSDEKAEKTITIKKEGINYRLKTSDIISVQAILRGVSISLRKEVLQVKYLTIRQMSEELSGCPEFIQCHRNSIINTNYIENIDMVNRMIHLTGKDEPVEIGVTYKPEIKKLT